MLNKSHEGSGDGFVVEVAFSWLALLMAYYTGSGFLYGALECGLTGGIDPGNMDVSFVGPVVA